MEKACVKVNEKINPVGKQFHCFTSHAVLVRLLSLLEKHCMEQGNSVSVEGTAPELLLGKFTGWILANSRRPPQLVLNMNPAYPWRSMIQNSVNFSLRFLRRIDTTKMAFLSCSNPTFTVNQDYSSALHFNTKPDDQMPIMATCTDIIPKTPAG